MQTIKAAENAVEVERKCECGKREFNFSWCEFKNKTNHIRCECSTCRQFIQWAKQRVNVNTMPSGSYELVD